MILRLKKNNLSKGGQYYCSNCKPTTVGNKLKYDVNTQKWISYRIKIDCHNCNKEKWVFTKKYNNNNMCGACDK